MMRERTQGWERRGETWQFNIQLRAFGCIHDHHNLLFCKCDFLFFFALSSIMSVYAYIYVKCIARDHWLSSPLSLILFSPFMFYHSKFICEPNTENYFTLKLIVPQIFYEETSLTSNLTTQTQSTLHFSLPKF